MQIWLEAEKEAATAENLARRSRRQKGSVLTYIILWRFNDLAHERILDGLYALGYTSDDIPKHYEFDLRNSLCKEWNRLLNRNQVLNERSECFGRVCPLLCLTYQKQTAGWKALLPKLEDVLRRTKECRQQVTLKSNRFSREKDVCNLYEAYIVANFSDADRALVPNAWDLLALSPVRELIEEDACSLVITEERWRPILELVLRDKFFEAYRERVTKDCTMGLVAACPDAQEDIFPGTLSVFPAYIIVAEKTNAANMIYWKEPRTLYESMLARAKETYVPAEEPSLGLIAEISFPRSVWDTEKLRFESDAIFAAKSLLSSCGMSLETPVTEMLEYGTELKCARCPAECRRRMTWVEIVSSSVFSCVTITHLSTGLPLCGRKQTVF